MDDVRPLVEGTGWSDRRKEKTEGGGGLKKTGPGLQYQKRSLQKKVQRASKTKKRSAYGTAQTDD